MIGSVKTPSCSWIFIGCSNMNYFVLHSLQENVRGKKCTKCKPGTFTLQSKSPLGCTKCFCFGNTDSCAEAGYMVDMVSISIPSPDWSKWIIVSFIEPISDIFRKQIKSLRKISTKHYNWNVLSVLIIQVFSRQSFNTAEVLMKQTQIGRICLDHNVCCFLIDFCWGDS